MEQKKSWKKLPLGVPLALAGAGTILSLAVAPRLHVPIGILWTGLSILHGLQHAGKMKRDLSCEPPKMKKKTLHLKEFLAAFSVTSFRTGEVRLQNSLLRQNLPLAIQVEDYVASFCGVERAEVDPVQGSLRIVYAPEKLRQNKKLGALEEKLRMAAF